MSESERDLSILAHIIRYCEQIDETIRRMGDDGQVFASEQMHNSCVKDVQKMLAR